MTRGPISYSRSVVRKSLTFSFSSRLQSALLSLYKDKWEKSCFLPLCPVLYFWAVSKEGDLLFICPIRSTFQRRKVLKQKTNFSWVYPLPIATSQVIQTFVKKIKLVLLAVWNIGEIDWQNRCIDTSSCLFSFLGFSSRGGGIEEEPANYFHLMSLKTKEKVTYPAFQSSVTLSTASNFISLLLFDLKKPSFVKKNLKFKVIWSGEAPLNSHCGLEPCIIKAGMLRWCTAPIHHWSAIPLMIYYYNSQLEHHQWCMAAKHNR